MDKSGIIEILNEWNYWNKELPQTQIRTIYDNRISTLLNYNEVLVLKGIRRGGKFTLMLNCIKNLLANAYVEYLIEAYMIFEVPKFDYSLKKQNVNDKNIIVLILSSRILCAHQTLKLEDDLEMVVFLELLIK